MKRHLGGSVPLSRVGVRWLASGWGVIGIVLLLGSAAFAINDQAGTSGAQFLKIGAGSRAGSMAEAFSAVADDAYSFYYNPAAATRLTEPQLGAAHTAYFQGANYEVASFGYPLPWGREEKYSKHVLGIAIYNLSVADIERRTGDTTASIGTFGAGDYAYAVSYAYRWHPNLSVGGTGKVIYQTIDTFSSAAFAADLGALYTPRPDANRPVHLAGVLKNLGTRPEFAGGVSDPLPLGLTIGAGCDLLPKRLTLDVDLSKYRDTDPFFSAGGEFRHPFGEGVSGALRAGYTSQRKDNDGLNGIALGMGFTYYRASFDFGWVPFGSLGDTFRYSLLIRFGGGGTGK